MAAIGRLLGRAAEGATWWGVPRRDFFEEYEMMVLLGSGSYGEVWVCARRALGETSPASSWKRVGARRLDQPLPGAEGGGGTRGSDGTRRLDLMRRYPS